MNYSVIDKELTAAFMAVHHFRHLLDRNFFMPSMDLLPTVQAFTKISDPWSNRQSRMLQCIAEFPITVEYVPGENNVVADLFSRTVSTIRPPSLVTMPSRDQFISNQGNCPAVKSLAFSPSLSVMKKAYKTRDLLVDTSTEQEHVLVSNQLRLKVFQALNNMAHPGIRGSR